MTHNDMVSIRERLYDLTLRLSSTDPEASHTAHNLYLDMCDATNQPPGVGMERTLLN